MPNPGALGIDFGTSHTVAVMRRDDGSTEPLLFDGSPLLPSAVFAETSGAMRVGRDAAQAARMDPARLEPNPKRRVDDETVLLGDRELPVVELIAAVLTRVREECVRVLGDLPATVTLTHPAAWGPSRRLVLTDAAQRAGLENVTLLPEPVAAARYFVSVLNHRVPDGGAVVVHDLGGGTFDASVVSRTATGFQVLAVDGRHDLGGLDMDEALVKHLRAELVDDAGWTRLLESADPADLRHRRALFDDVRAAKEGLSRHSAADVAVPILDRDAHITRAELETVVAPLVKRAARVTEAVVRAAYLPADLVAGVFLVGGASRMPLVATTLHQCLDNAPVVIDQPELVVAHGATLDNGSAPSDWVPPHSAEPASQLPPIPAGGHQFPWSETELSADPPRRRTATALLAIAAVFALLLMGITGIGNAIGGDGALSSSNVANSDVVHDAKLAAKALLSYDYRSMNGAIANGKKYTTEKFGEEYERLMKDLRASAEREEATVDASVVDVGVIEEKDGAVELLAFVNQSTENKNIEGTKVDQSRVVMIMVPSESRWKVNDLKAI